MSITSPHSAFQVQTESGQKLVAPYFVCKRKLGGMLNGFSKGNHHRKERRAQQCGNEVVMQLSIEISISGLHRPV